MLTSVSSTVGDKKNHHQGPLPQTVYNLLEGHDLHPETAKNNARHIMVKMGGCGLTTTVWAFQGDGNMQNLEKSKKENYRSQKLGSTQGKKNSKMK